MSKRMSNSKRAREKRNRENRDTFLDAIADGYTSRRDICKAMGLASHELTEFFEDNPKSYKIYASRRRELVDIAADNIQDIVEDKTHPSHYNASKYVLDHYKTDLDNILDQKDGDDVKLNLDSTGSGVVIKFTKPGKKED
jgi:hypothetical protein